MPGIEMKLLSAAAPLRALKQEFFQKKNKYKAKSANYSSCGGNKCEILLKFTKIALAAN